MSKEIGTVFIHSPIASLSPNNPAGIGSLLRAANGEVQYLDLNEGLLLGWMLKQQSLQEIVLDYKGDTRFTKGLQNLNLTEDRVEEVIQNADRAREDFAKIETYENFHRYVECKRILDDAAKIVSAPFVSKEESEYILIHHNTFGYYNSQFDQSRKSLVSLSESAGLFKSFIRDQALPQILEGNPKMVGISVTHPDQYIFAFQLAHQIRQARPEIITLFGGGTISRRAETWVQNDKLNQHIFRNDRSESTGLIDGLVVSEGELAIAQLTAKLVENPNINIQEIFDNVYGTVFKKDGRIVFNSLPKTFYPEGLWKRNDIYSHLKRGLMPEQRKMHSLVDGRVCTYECTTGGCEFCAISKGYLELTHQSVRRLKIPQRQVPSSSVDLPQRLNFSPETTEDGKRGIKIIDQRRLGADRMAAEIQEGLRNGFSVVDITDEQFSVDQALELALALEKRGINVNNQDIVYACYMRIDDTGDKTNYKQKYGKSLPDLLEDPAIIARLSKGGLRFAQFGLETTYPPKIQAMVKGTSESKVQRFGTMLKNFADNGIMSHVFIIVGYPLKKNYWGDKNKFAFEESMLGRTVDADDLEILEAIYNLKFLHDHKDFIFTFKHAPYELAYGSPMANRPEEFGLQVDLHQFERTDLACSIPFNYSDAKGLSKLVLDDLMDLYSLWKREEMPYQPVVQEFQYSQRIIQELGAVKIKEIAKSLNETKTGKNDSIKKMEILGRLWGKLTSGDRLSNKIYSLFPDGFHSYDDLYQLAEKLETQRGEN